MTKKLIKLRYVLPIASAVLASFGWLFVRSVHAASTTSLSGTIADSTGTGVNGVLTMALPVPAQFNVNNSGCSGGISQIVQPGPVVYRLVNGNISQNNAPPLFDVACLSPANLFYIASVYDSNGTLLLRGNYVVTGASFNIGTATPTTVTTSNISYANVGGSISTGAPNTWTAPQTFSQIISSTTNHAAAGFIEMANTDIISWRNGNNTSDVQLGVGSGPGATALLSIGGNNLSGVGTCGANQFVNALNAVGGNATGGPICAQPSAANLSNGTTGSGNVVLSSGPTLSPASITMNTSVANNGTGFQHLRFTGCTVTSGSCSGTANWNATWASTSYTVTCTSFTNTPGGSVISVAINSKSTTTLSYQLTTYASNTFTQGFEVDCIGVHD